jgi:Zn-dependent protease with chaperone function
MIDKATLSNSLISALLAAQIVQLGCSTQSEQTQPAPPALQRRIEPASAAKSVRAARPKQTARDDRPVSQRSPPPTACGESRKGPLPTSLTVSVDQTRVFIQPRVLPVPLAQFPRGVRLPVVETEGDWFLIRFDDRRWDTRVGYVHCSNVIVSAASMQATASPPSSSTAQHVPIPGAQPSQTNRSPLTPMLKNQPAQAQEGHSSTKSERLSGYLEWRREDYIVVDGQRIRWDVQTRLNLGRVSSVADIPLGYEINAKGVRTSDGGVLAHELDAKPNGIAAYENQVLQDSDEVEAAWTRTGAMFQIAPDGTRRDGARIAESGPEIDRVRRIVVRLVPPYVDAARVRIHVVQTNELNARAMENGAIWVYKGLLDDVSDDELAFVLGHELAHYTHEHSRRGMRNTALVRLTANVAQIALNHVDSAAKSAALSVGGNLALRAWMNGYSRQLEDQADRVGLRYAYEGGFDVARVSGMWQRILERDGQLDRVSNFVLGSHSRESDRIRNIERELRLNYSESTLR